MRRFLFSIFFFWFAGSLFAQNDICRKSTEGTEFWFGFMESRHYQTDHYLEITVTAKETTTFEITIGPEETPFNETYTVNAGTAVQVKIPWDLAEAIGSEEVQNKGIHLTSEKPVNVYALNWSMNSADVAVIYPVFSLGTEYFAACYYPSIDINNPNTGNGRNSEFLIVATEDSTMVEITPSRVTDKKRPADSTFSVLLNKGQVYQVQSENEPGTNQEGQGDLTGSYILASKPVAFYSGSLSTRIPTTQCCWDHLYEQIPPVHSWGIEYYLAPLKTRQQDRYRILASQNNTRIYISGESPESLNRGEFKEIVLYHDNPKRILADKPILVIQYSQSRDVDSEFTGGDGDPFMIVLSPVNQSLNNVTFVAYQSPDLDLNDYEGITKYFVNIISLTSEVENIRLNNQTVSDQFQEFPGGNYSFAQVQIDAGANQIENVNQDAGFLAYVYGYGGVESYGYGVGFNLDLTLDLGESIEFLGDTILLCYGNTLTLDAGSYFDSYLWKTGETTQTLNVTKEGWYHVNTTTIDGCELEDSVFVFVSHPVTNLGTDYEEGCMPFELELSADEGYQRYVWQNDSGDTLSVSQTFTANKTGNYSITVFDNYNCTASDTMELVIFPVPETEFSGPALMCGKKTATLSVLVSGTSETLWNYEGGAEWSTNKPSLLAFSEITRTSLKMEATDWGDYEIYYHIKTTDGCEKTDTFSIRFHPQPEAGFMLEEDEKCKGYSQILTFDGTATDSATFHWDLDGCQFLDTLGRQNYLVSVGAFLDEPSSISLFINDNGCISDTILKPVGANPNFTMEASQTRGCDELTVDFTGTLLTEDVVEFKWEFDDGETGTTPTLTKHYPEPGIYGVRLTVTNPVTQCRNSFFIHDMIKVFPTPTAAISANPDFCYPDSVQLIYPHNIDSTVCIWEFEGMHQVGPGNDSIAVVLDNPTANVSLVVDEYGCISEPFGMQLKRKPRFDFFTDTPEGCQPYAAEIFAETEDSQIQFYWITDSLPYPAGTQLVLTSADTGTYDVGLIAHSSETGCTDTLMKTGWIQVHPKPFANFRMDYPVAFIENARISFLNKSQYAESFLWNFGDGGSAIERDPVHTYEEPGEYISQLIAETEHGCKDTSELLVTILPSTVYTPNAFRPGSPLEINRTFMPVEQGINPLRFNLKIYDRSGQMVFESRSPGKPWNGTLPNGNPAPVGNYVWIARYFDIQGMEREQKGQVLLIR